MRLCYAFSHGQLQGVAMQLARLFLALIFWFSGSAWALDNSELFAKALKAYESRNELLLEDYARQMHARDYIVAPYADYWLMLLRLSTADNATVRKFLNRYPDLPFTDRVRGEWLKQLAKRGDWQTFFEEYPHYRRDDVAVTCHALARRAEQGDLIALTEGKAIWMVAKDQPQNCNALFERMIANNILNKDDIWERFRLALQDTKITLASSIVQWLPDRDQSDAKLVNAVYGNPKRTLERRSISFKTRYGQELNLFALERLYRSDSDAALALWQDLQSRFEPEQRAYLWGRFALHAAREHDPAALEWFKRAQQHARLDKEQLAWHARAAMRVKNWNEVQAAIEAMTPEQQQEDTWQYWKARVLKEQGQVPTANAILVKLARQQGYYGLLAEEELGDVLREPVNPYQATQEEIRAVAQLPGIRRAFELHELGQRWESRAEWVWAVRDFSDSQLIAAAEAALKADWYDIAINTAEKTKTIHDFNLRYPTPYRDMMKDYARENELDEAWVYGLIRQESRFISYAKSGAGASGLMQVMPATAKWIAKRLGEKRFQPSAIHQVETNIRYGTHYMRYSLDRMGGQALMATAGYNAGPSRPKRWAGAQPLEGAIYAETIPFSETRDYVKKVMSNAYYYAQRLGTKTLTLKQRLGVVDGSDSGADAVLIVNENK
jgi:soluble lytic murein transglycosylase